MKWHWVLECVEGHPVIKTKDKVIPSSLMLAENTIVLEMCKNKPKNGREIKCKCGKQAIGCRRRITDKSWGKLKSACYTRKARYKE